MLHSGDSDEDEPSSDSSGRNNGAKCGAYAANQCVAGAITGQEERFRRGNVGRAKGTQPIHDLADSRIHGNPAFGLQFPEGYVVAQ